MLVSQRHNALGSGVERGSFRAHDSVMHDAGEIRITSLDDGMDALHTPQSSVVTKHGGIPSAGKDMGIISIDLSFKSKNVQKRDGSKMMICKVSTPTPRIYKGY